MRILRTPVPALWRAVAVVSALAVGLGPLAIVDAATTGLPNAVFQETFAGPVNDVAMNAAGTRTVLADDSGGLTLVKSSSGRSEGKFTFDSPAGGLLAEIEPRFTHAAVTPEGRHWAGALAFESQLSGKVYGFDESSAEPIWVYDLPLPQGVNVQTNPTALAVGGPYYVVGTDKGHVILLDIDDERSPKPYVDLFSQDDDGNAFQSVGDVDVSGDGNRVLIGTRRAGIPTVHVFSDDFFERTLSFVTNPVADVAMSRDGKLGLIASGAGAESRVWMADLATGARLWDVGYDASATRVAMSADGGLAAVGLANGKVYVYVRDGDSLKWRTPRQAFSTSGAVQDLAVPADGDYVVASSATSAVYFLSPLSRDPLWSFDMPGAVSAAAVSDDADYLGAATREGGSGRLIHFAAMRHYQLTGGGTLVAEPAKAQGLALKLANAGNRADLFTVEASGAPAGWAVKVPASVSPLPGRTSDVGVQVTAAAGALPGTYPFVVAASGERGHLLTQTVTVRVPEVLGGGTDIEDDNQGALPGTDVVYRLILTNSGNLPNEARVAVVNLPAGFAARVDPEGPIPLAPLESKAVTITVTPPADAQAGDIARIQLSIAWLHEEQEQSLIVQIVERAEDLLDLPPLEDGSGRETRMKGAGGEETNVKKKGVPAPGLGLSLLAIVAVAGILARRRRDP